MCYQVIKLPTIQTPLVNKFYNLHRARGRAARHDQIWVAKVGSSIIAACRIQPVESYWLIVGVLVAPKYRKQGIASALLAQATIQFRQENHDKPLYTFCYSHLILFYKALNFVEADATLPAALENRLQAYVRQKRDLVAMYYD
ncbi:GNAT family N-acetyltransferase [Pseudoalteromonas sp. T1lg65]|uniref:GNAT family N-acetyltransferase n=1 Tax=Pseudoalteromonas sp. T1lg65 TaxID=2077101 RepID=UPI003F79C883